MSANIPSGDVGWVKPVHFSSESTSLCNTTGTKIIFASETNRDCLEFSTVSTVYQIVHLHAKTLYKLVA